mgnify:CR=1 FL=1
MAARLVRLRTKADKLQADKAAALRQMILGFDGLPERAAGELLAAIDRSTAADNGWTFVMMSPADNARVVSWLLDNAKRPQVAVRLWSTLFLHLRRDTGEVMQTRDELAEAVGVRSLYLDVSLQAALAALPALGATGPVNVEDAVARFDSDLGPVAIGLQGIAPSRCALHVTIIGTPATAALVTLAGRRLRAEREQGITIDVAYRYFSTPRRRFILADCPGHVQYTRNMVTGATTADAVVVGAGLRRPSRPPGRG